MAVFPIQLLIAVCLCVISSRCQADRIFCSEDSLTEITVYAVPQNNEINCWRHYHGEGATYSWSRYQPSQRGYYPIPVNSNVTIDGSILRFNYSSINVGFKCDIQKANNEDTGPIVYRVIQSIFRHYYPEDTVPDVYVPLYKSKSLKCPITYDYVGDLLRIVWYRFDHRHQIQEPVLDTAFVYVDERGYLNFSPVRREDNKDKFMCVISAPKLNVRIEGPNITLYVTSRGDTRPKRPLLFYASPNVQARTNDNVTLECVFGNNNTHRVKYRWYQPDGRAVGTGPYMGQSSHQRLFLDFIQPNHTGYWYCGADTLQYKSFRQGIYVLVTC